MTVIGDRGQVMHDRIYDAIVHDLTPLHPVHDLTPVEVSVIMPGEANAG